MADGGIEQDRRSREIAEKTGRKISELDREAVERFTVEDMQIKRI